MPVLALALGTRGLGDEGVEDICVLDLLSLLLLIPLQPPLPPLLLVSFLFLVTSLIFGSITILATSHLL